MRPFGALCLLIVGRAGVVVRPRYGGRAPAQGRSHDRAGTANKGKAGILKNALSRAWDNKEDGAWVRANNHNAWILVSSAAAPSIFCPQSCDAPPCRAIPIIGHFAEAGAGGFAERGKQSRPPCVSGWPGFPVLSVRASRMRDCRRLSRFAGTAVFAFRQRGLSLGVRLRGGGVFRVISF